MDLEFAEWGFIPASAAVTDALAALWSPGAGWEPEWEMEWPGADDGVDHVCAL